MQLYNKAVEAFVSLKEKFVGYLERAVELDGSFLLAHCFLVCHRSNIFDVCTIFVFPVDFFLCIVFSYCPGFYLCGLPYESIDWS